VSQILAVAFYGSALVVGVYAGSFVAEKIHGTRMQTSIQQPDKCLSFEEYEKMWQERAEEVNAK